MKKVGVIALLFFVMGIVYFFGSMKMNLAPRSYYALVTTNSNLSDENINGLRLYHSIKDDWFTRKYGKEYERMDNVLFDYYKIKDGLVIATQKGNDRIIRISVTDLGDEVLKTNKGIGIGDSIEKVKQLYGGSYYTRSEQGSNIIGYVDGKVTMEFWLADNKINQIRYDISSMN